MVSGTLVTIGTRLETRIVGVDRSQRRDPPAASMLVVHNDDRPGIDRHGGVALGERAFRSALWPSVPTSARRSALMVLFDPDSHAVGRHRSTSRHGRHSKIFTS